MAENGKKKKGIVGKVVIGVVVLVVIAAVAGSMGGNKPTVADSSDAAKQEQQDGTSSGGDQGAGESKQEEKSTENLAVGTAVDLGDGLTVSADSVETVSDYSGAQFLKVTLTYKNGSEKTVSYNSGDWKGEDANGAQENADFFVSSDPNAANDQLSYGDLAAGGTKTGALYFKQGTVKLLYSGNVFSKDIKASWKLA